MRRTVNIEGGTLTLYFSPALVIGDESIYVSVCHLSEPTYNIDYGSRDVIWFNADGTENHREKLYRGLYDRSSIKTVVDRFSDKVMLDWELSEHCFIRNIKSGTTEMTMPGLDKILGLRVSKGRHKLYRSRWLRVSCDAVDVTNNEADGTLAEFPNLPILGFQRYEVNSWTRLRPGAYQSMTFTVLDDDGLVIDAGKVTLEFYITAAYSPVTPARLLLRPR